MREHITGEVCPVCGNKVSTEKQSTVHSAGKHYHKKCWKEIAPESWSADDEAEFRRLNRKRMKIYRDKNRQRKYTPRIKDESV